MRHSMHVGRLAGGLWLAALLSACGGGGGGSGLSAPPPVINNVAAVTVDSGPSNNSVNTLFVSVKFCVPGSTTNCQTVDHIQVDTGSYGLRVLSSAMSLNLPLQATTGGSLVECVPFVDGYSFGPVVTADITIGGETAAGLPVQVIGDSRFPTVPSDCSSTGTQEDTVAQFGANGILGIGPFAYDCGDLCASSVQPASYYACNGASCNGVPAPLAQQVQSPIMHFTTDNNGAILQLPTVAATGAATVSGSLIFGIDTESNNASGTQTILTVDNQAFLTVGYNSQSLTQSFLDSGTNGTYFNDSSLAASACKQSGITDFYCPASTQNLMATITGANSITVTADFSVGNANTQLSANPTFTAFPELAGPYPGTTSTFDFGLPFFYGKRVAVALEGSTTMAGTGPYFAF